MRARHFNPRTGRFTQPDPFWNVGNMQGGPLTMMQSGNLFVFAVHNPVRFIDPSGLVIRLAENATRSQIQAFDRAIEYLMTSPTARGLIEYLQAHEEVVHITFNNNFQGSFDNARHQNAFTRTINWDPRGGAVINNSGHTVSPALILAHELGHAWQDLSGYFMREDWFIGDLENHVVRIFEIQIARELGEFHRTHYSTVRWVGVPSSTDWGISHIPSWWPPWNNRPTFIENLNTIRIPLVERQFQP